MDKGRCVRLVCLLTTLCTGATALVYEVTWHAYLSNLLGSQARSAALILATFLGGLAIGYSVFGKFSIGRSARSLVLAVGVIEAGIGVWACVFDPLFQAAFHLRFESGMSQGSLVTDIVVAAALIGIPTIFMGGSLPLLTQGLSRDVRDAAPLHARLYVVNTLGAFIGASGAGFYFLPHYGLSSTMVRMGALNVAAGLVLAIVSRSLSTAVSRPGDDNVALGMNTAQASGSGRGIIELTALAFLGGAVSIIIQSVLIRIIGLSVGASIYAFSLVVGAYVLALALGAWILAEKRGNSLSLYQNQLLVVGGLIGVYAIVPYLPYSSHVLRSLLTNQIPNFYLYYAVVFVSLVCLILVPVGALGATLPLVFRDARNRADTLGSRVGILYSANTIGCVCGALFGGYLSLRYLNLDGVWRGCIVISSFVLMGLGRRKIWTASLGIAGIVVAVVANPWPHQVLGRGTFRMTTANAATYRGFEAFYENVGRHLQLIAYKDDPNSTIAVGQSSDGSRSVIVNGKSDGSTRGGDRVTTKLMAHLPGLLQVSENSRAAVVGFGTGITVGSLSRYDEIQSIDILEISTAVREFSRFFDDENGAASKNPKVNWQIGDAYRFLLEAPHSYAIIASEPSNPWVGGVERLYSQEFYKLIREKLAPGGVYAQWFHTYSISEETLAMVLHTFQTSFQDVHLFERDTDVVLIGSNQTISGKNLEMMRQRFARESIRQDLEDVDIGRLDIILGLEPWVPWKGLMNQPVHTLDKPKLSYWAGKDFFLERSSSVSGMANQPYYRGWSKISFVDTLLGRLYVSAPVEDRTHAMSIMYCDFDAGDQQKVWAQASAACKQAIFASVVEGSRESIPEIPQDIVTLFKSLAPSYSGDFPAASSVSEASKHLDWVVEYGRPFLEIDPVKMRRYADVCFKDSREVSAGCRSRLILALASNGFWAEAGEEFEQMLRDKLAFRSREAVQLLARVANRIVTPEQLASVPIISDLDLPAGDAPPV